MCCIKKPKAKKAITPKKKTIVTKKKTQKSR
jgi:hypothetical protein